MRVQYARFAIVMVAIIAVCYACVELFDRYRTRAPHPAPPYSTHIAERQLPDAQELSQSLDNAIASKDSTAFRSVQSDAISRWLSGDHSSDLYSLLIRVADIRASKGAGEPLLLLDVVGASIPTDILTGPTGAETLSTHIRLLGELGMMSDQFAILKQFPEVHQEDRLLLERFMATALPADHAALGAVAERPQRLAALLAVPAPEAITPDYVTALEEEHGSSLHHDERTTNGGLLGMLALQERTTTISGVDDDVGKSYRVQLLEHVRDLELPAVDALATLTDTEIKTKLGSWFRDQLATKSSACAGPAANQLRLSAITNSQGLTVAVLAADQYASGDPLSAIFLLHHTRETTEASFVLGDFWNPVVDIVHVLDDGRPQLLVQDRRSSGGYLGAVLLSASGDALWQVDSLYHGNVFVAQLDDDSDCEIVTTRATHDRLGSTCNQCPSRITTSVFDYRREANKFECAGAVQNTAESGVTAVSRAFINMDSETFLVKSLHARDYLSREGCGAEFAMQAIGDIYRAIQAFFANDNADAAGTAAEFLSQHHDEIVKAHPDLSMHIWSGVAWASRGLCRDGQLARADALMGLPWFIAGGETVAEVRAEYESLLSERALKQGDYGTAMRRLNTLNETYGVDYHVADLEWLYFRHIGDIDNQLSKSELKIDSHWRRHFHTSEYDIREDYRELQRGEEGTYARFLGERATALLELRDFDAAIRWTERSLAEARQCGGPALARACLVGARLSLELGEPRLAIRFLDEALSGMRQATWQDIGTAWLLVYAKALRATGQTRLAQATLRACTQNTADAEPLVASTGFYEAAMAARDRGDHTEAVELLRNAIALAMRVRGDALTEAEKFITLVGKDELIDSWLDLAHGAHIDDETTFTLVQRWKMQVFQDMHGTASPGDKQQNDLLGSIRARARADTLVLDFVWSRGTLYRTCIAPGAPLIVSKLDVQRDEVERLGRGIAAQMDIRNPTVVRDIRADRVPEELEQSLSRLGTLLLGDLNVDGRVRHIVVSPAAGMYGLPWGALRYRGSYLIERWGISVEPSLGFGSRRSAHAETQDKPTALIVASTAKPARGDQDGATSMQVGPLRHGQEEVRAVAGALSSDAGVDMVGLDSRTMTRDELVSLMRSRNVIHLVCHGLFDSEDPMASRLLIDWIEEGGELTASDVANADLSSVQLVVMSACQTGRVEDKSFGEPLGFVRALQGAGAHHVLLTLWEVDDFATSRMIGVFYARKGWFDVAEQLAQSQRDVMRKWKHPYYWAGVSAFGW